MDSITLEYLFLGIMVLMVFFAFLIGTSKMLQVIIATTCITLVVLWWSGLITFVSNSIAQNSTLTIFWFWPQDISSFLKSARITTSIFIVWGLLAYVLQYSSPLVVSSSDTSNSKIFQLILSPLAIFTTIVTLIVAVVWIDIFSLSYLSAAQAQFWPTSFVSIILNYMPLCIFLQALLTLFIVFRKENKVKEFTYNDMTSESHRSL